MDLDWIIFPSPESSYTVDNLQKGELLYIPKKQYSKVVDEEDINYTSK